MLAGHQNIEWLGASDGFRIARARYRDAPVLLKLLDTQEASPLAIARLQREYALLQTLAIPGIPPPLDFVSDAGTLAIVFEDFDGELLDQALGRGRFTLARCLRAAARIAQALEGLHRAGIVHGRLHAGQVLIANDGVDLRLIDLGFAIRHGVVTLVSNSEASTDLASRAPEQSGRLAPIVDARTDLYALGALLYRMLTGEPAFAASEPLEVLHWQLARLPRAPAKLDSSIAPLLSDIVMKLLAKAPEERYQSARSLTHDLAHCLELLEVDARLPAFPLDSHAPPAPAARSALAAASAQAANERLDALALAKAARAVSSQLAPDAMLDIFMRVLIEHAGAQSGFLVMVDGETLTLAADANALERETSVRVHEQLPVSPELLPLSLLDQVRRERQPVILAPAHEAASEDPYLARRHPRSALCLPVLRASEIIGLLYLENNLLADVFSHERLALLQVLASQMVTALDNEQLRAGLQYDEERFRYLALAVHDAIYDWDMRTGNIWRNDAYEALYGLREPAHPDKDWWKQHLHPDDRERIIGGMDNAFRERNRLWIDEYRLQRADGGYATVIDRGYILYDTDGQPVRMMGAITDITERKQEKEALRERDARIRHLMESNIIGIFFWDLNGQVTDANDAFLNTLGFTREDLETGRVNWQRLTPPEFAAVTAKAVDELNTVGRCTPYEKEYFSASGERVPVLIGSSLLRGSNTRGVSYILDLTERKRAENRIRYLAQHDALTGLPNRLLLHDRVSHAISQAHRSNDMVGMLFIDLDHFKHINDSLGHQIGDRLLRAAARRLQRCLREGDSVARLGGDEFVIGLAGIRRAEDAAQVAQKVLEALNRPFIVDGTELHVTGSVGISLYPDDGHDTDSLMRTADIAMYHAKERGRNNYQFFTSGLNDVARWRLEMATRLHQALERNEFELHYQPQVEIGSGKVLAAEALIRWHKSDAELISCGDFLKVAEETGIITDIGEWALRQACRQVKRWRANGRADMRVAVNLSPRQFRQPGFYDLIAGVLKENDLPGNALELEITESVLMLQDPDNILALERLFVLGVQLSVDDFGMGYSSLTYVQRFPIHALKIDRSFVNGIGRDPNDTAIVNAVIAMGKSLHLRVIAEGVENDEQLAFLEEQQCTAVQGYYFSHALPPEQLDEILNGPMLKHGAA
jgi:diguanylate cyclase (GGDEF)-like protein/PAS domain S-box-containing protein